MSEDMNKKNPEAPIEEAEHNHAHTHDENCNHDHDHDHDHEHIHDENCDHDHDHGVAVVIENEDGTTEEYPVVDEFEFNDCVYVLVENEDGTVTPLRSVGEEGDLEFLTEDEFIEVSKAYNEFMEEYDEEEEEEEEEEEN